MKKVLSLLLSVVFLQSQALAISGGPDFGGLSVNVVGTFSGVLVPQFEAGINVNTGSAGSNLNSIGIFSIGVPQAGVATGAFAFFGNAQAYNGTIVGIADPDRGTLRAILDAPTTLRTGTVSNNQGNSVSSTFVGQAIGSMNAAIVPALSFFSTASARLIGDAHLDVFEGDFNADLSVAVASTFDFVVDGFKQSNQVQASTITLGSGG